jgi:tRNA nucleotidyltransferase (CCA-adding enzyme)
VGGAVRDALLERKREHLDFDLVLPEKAIQTAREIANRYNGGFVILDEERRIARVVFEGLTVDFAQQEGADLETDLGRRDYTVNAIAYNLHSGEIIDPLGGNEDLKNRRMRMVKPKNLEDDPLRLLRAYRQAAQLGFTIEENTLATIRTLAPLLIRVAAERVQTELNYLLASLQGTYWLMAAVEDGLFSIYFTNTDGERFNKIPEIDRAAEELRKTWSEFAQLPNSWYALAKLACLLSPNPTIAESELINLKYSRHDIKTVINLLKSLPTLLAQTETMSLREQYFFFLEVGQVFPLVAIQAIAFGMDKGQIIPLIERYLSPEDKVAHPQPLITGNDLIKDLQLKPSPEIGRLLTEVQIAQIEGIIHSREEALEFALKKLNE